MLPLLASNMTLCSNQNSTDQRICTPINESILQTVGNTPIVALKKLFSAYEFEVYGKLENANPGGSIKDRTALNILQEAWSQGLISSGDTIIESSSGNMAIGLAQTCLYYGLKLIVVVDTKVNQRNVKILEAYGAKVEYVQQPITDGGYLGARLQRVQQLLDRYPGSFWTNQYANKNNPLAHERTINEIMNSLDFSLDYLFVATSTCGTLAGCANYLKKLQLPTQIIAVDAVGSVIFGSAPAKRLIPGHGAGRPSQFLKEGMASNVIHISDQDCIMGCHELLHTEAILAGGSTGGIVSAIKSYASQIPSGAKVGMIICDRGERYLETIYNQEWIQQHFPELHPQAFAA